MVEPYEPLPEGDKTAHTTRTTSGYKAIHASGQAHFYNNDQASSLPTIEAATGIFERNGLDSPYSNGPSSRQYSTVTPTNPYRDLTSKKEINISSLLTNATFEFNIYSQAFRK
jgi:hypothetical protein